MSSRKGPPPTGIFRRGAILLSLSAGIARQEVTNRILGSSAVAKNLDRIRQAKRIVEELGHLKGAAMKVGQMLALEGRGFLPPEALLLLERLQNSAPPLPYEAVSLLLREDLGERSALLEDLSPVPLAAASIGQVHTARYRSQKVVVKIQYPGIRETIGADLAVLKTVLGGFVRLFRPELRIEGVLDELEVILRQEVDYEQEARFAVEYRSYASGLPGIHVPEVMTEVSGPRVLTLEYRPGKPIPRWIREDRPDSAARLQIANRLLDLYTREFVEWGLVQTDPNPGNFLIDPHTSELTVLDFGATRRYSPEFRKNYGEFVACAWSRDTASALEAAARLELLDRRESERVREAFLRLTFASMEPFRQSTFRFGDPLYLDQMISIR